MQARQLVQVLSDALVEIGGLKETLFEQNKLLQYYELSAKEKDTKIEGVWHEKTLLELKYDDLRTNFLAHVKKTNEHIASNGDLFKRFGEEFLELLQSAPFLDEDVLNRAAALVLVAEQSSATTGDIQRHHQQNAPPPPPPPPSVTVAGLLPPPPPPPHPVEGSSQLSQGDAMGGSAAFIPPEHMEQRHHQQNAVDNIQMLSGDTQMHSGGILDIDLDWTNAPSMPNSDYLFFHMPDFDNYPNADFSNNWNARI